MEHQHGAHRHGPHPSNRLRMSSGCLGPPPSEDRGRREREGSTEPRSTPLIHWKARSLSHGKMDRVDKEIQRNGKDGRTSSKGPVRRTPSRTVQHRTKKPFFVRCASRIQAPGGSRTVARRVSEMADPATMTVHEALRALRLDPKDASDPEGCVDGTLLRSRFRKLALKHHPDKNGGSEQAAEAFRRVAAAYEFLRRDEEGRKKFDVEEFRSKCDVPLADELDEILARAMKGEDVEMLLRKKGVYRPPSNFGVFPFPKWEKQERCPISNERKAKQDEDEEYTAERVEEIITHAFASDESESEAEDDQDVEW